MIHIITLIIHTHMHIYIFFNMILEKNVLSLAVLHIGLSQETLDQDFGVCLGCG